MFVLDYLAEMPGLLFNEPWGLVACASFEERCVGVVNSAIGTVPTRLDVVDAVDAGSHWQQECTLAQQRHLAGMLARHATASVHAVSLADSDLAASCSRMIKEIIKGLVTANIRSVVIDVSAMPKVIMFPMVEAFLDEAAIAKVTVAYAQPATYGETLHSDPVLPPMAIPGHNRFPVDPDAQIAWMPNLGFGSFFYEHIYESLSQAGRLERRIYPLVGFPGFDPSLYDRMLLDNGDRLSALLTAEHALRDQFLFAPAWDPFETRDVVLRAVKALSPSVHWIASPMGPRPMALGILLAARVHPLSIMHVQSRSYHPNYSKGCGRIHAFPLKGP